MCWTKFKIVDPLPEDFSPTLVSQAGYGPGAELDFYPASSQMHVCYWPLPELTGPYRNYPSSSNYRCGPTSRWHTL